MRLRVDEEGYLFWTAGFPDGEDEPGSPLEPELEATEAAQPEPHEAPLADAAQ